MILDIFISLKHAITYFFIANYNVGQFIVSTSCLVVKTLYEVAEKIFCVLGIIIGDFHLFLQDFLREIVNFINIISTLFEDTVNVSLWIVSKVWSLLADGISVSKLETLNFFSSIYIFVRDLIISFINFVELCASGIWYLLTILPLSVYYSVIYSFNILKNVRSNMDSLCSTVITSYSEIEIPVGTVTRLLIFIIITYIIKRFYILFCRLSRKTSRLLYQIIVERFITFKFKTKTAWMQLVNKLFLKKSDNFEKSQISQLCIICEERSRCIVIVPCGHLCLCKECNDILKEYDHNCPICRQNIEQAVIVFL
ncbi:hypothetical protein WA026_022673 [Henosepilachna vigintioctopunctata]|uniref:RING-type domain-containing protein n=1 Tax=Henosepilachna vigintioctopunctata TaxID=420089 RepID=A0AAW1TZ03_9CUCU